MEDKKTILNDASKKEARKNEKKKKMSAREKVFTAYIVLDSTGKIFVAAIVAVILALAVLLTFVLVNAFRPDPPPSLDDKIGNTEETVRQRLTYLLSNTQEINDVLWGKGLPTYERVYSTGFSFKDSYGDGENKQEKNISGFVVDTSKYGTVVAYHAWLYFIPKDQDSGIYYDFENNVTLSKAPDDDSYYRFAVRVTEKREGEAQNTYLAENLKTDETYYYYDLADFDVNSLFIYTEKDELYYDYVVDNKDYLLVQDIRKEAQKYYSAEMLAIIEESILTGITVSEGSNGTLYPRYMDYEDTDTGLVYLMKYNQDDGAELKNWVYDFDTMQIVSGKSSTVKVSVERYPEGKAEERAARTFTFVLENGNWYLDAASY